MAECLPRLSIGATSRRPITMPGSLGSLLYHADVKRLVIADSHVGQRAGDAAEMANLVRRSAAAGFGEIVYLGDVFQYLIGMSKFWTDGVSLVIDAWREIRSDGNRVVVIEGNRDFFLDEPELAAEVDWTGRCYEFSAGPSRYRLVHGDRINLRDLQYQFWSRVSKSGIARVWARLLPRSIAVAIVRKMEARLATTNKRFRYRTPVDALRRNAHRAWQEGVDVLLWGHFHSLWRIDDGRRLAMVVPAWLETACSMDVDEDGGWRWVGRDLNVLDEPTRLPEFGGAQLRGDS
jgi:UDP-2,3-diacylglucosamine hydrolase